MDIVLIVSTLLGGAAAIWFFWDRVRKLFSKKTNRKIPYIPGMDNLSDRQKVILRLAYEDGQISISKLRNKLECSKSSIVRDIKLLLIKRLLERKVVGTRTFFTVSESSITSPKRKAEPQT